MSRSAPCYAALDAVDVRLPDGRLLLPSLTLALGDERIGSSAPMAAERAPCCVSSPDWSPRRRGA